MFKAIYKAILLALMNKTREQSVRDFFMMTVGYLFEGLSEV